ncbi:hypothetical protein ABC347_10290 [Sphingomonas sp. 1P06PA]|uniref:hypothetical protein n=1 Tax=Sphingomonas sp. 1P06PA TaxID=554121 RepID=UPI0039A6D1BA
MVRNIFDCRTDKARWQAVSAWLQPAGTTAYAEADAPRFIPSSKIEDSLAGAFRWADRQPFVADLYIEDRQA